MLISDNNKLSVYSSCVFKIIKTTALMVPQAIIMSDLYRQNERIVQSKSAKAMKIVVGRIYYVLSAFKRQEKVDLYKFKTSLLYRSSSEY